jgi:hypothetical protein
MTSVAASGRRHRPVFHRARGSAAALALGLALLPLCACAPEIQGNGVFRQEVRSVPTFSGVAVDIPIVTTVAVGPTQRVVVSGDENVLAQLESRVATDPARGLPVLDLRVDEAFVPVHPLRVDVTVPELLLVHAASSASVDVTGARGDALVVEAADGSTVSLSGAGGASLEVHLSGGARPGASLDATAYPVAAAAVALTGAARAAVRASGAVIGTAAAGCVVENVGAGSCQVTDGAGAPVSCAPP